jgi:hypothetical protein
LTPRARDIEIPLPASDLDAKDEAFMEPSRGNHWQPLANASGQKTAQTSRSATLGNPRQRFKTAW